VQTVRRELKIITDMMCSTMIGYEGVGKDVGLPIQHYRLAMRALHRGGAYLRAVAKPHNEAQDPRVDPAEEAGEGESMSNSQHGISDDQGGPASGGRGGAEEAKSTTVCDPDTNEIRCEVCDESIPMPLGDHAWVYAVRGAFEEVHRKCTGPSKYSIPRCYFVQRQVYR